MATFDIGIGGAPSSSIRPQAAVVDNTDASTLSLVSQLGNLAGDIFTGVAKGAEQKAIEQRKTMEASLLSGYAQKTSTLDAAVEQGKMTWSQAKARQRSMYNEFIANNPSMVEKVTDFHNKLAGTEGVGTTLSQGTAVDQQLETMKKEATAVGFITAGMTPDQQEAGVNAYQAQQKSISDMKYYSQQLEILQKKASIQASAESAAASRANRANAQAELQIKRNKMGAQASLSEYAVGVQAHLTTQLDALQSKVDKGELNQEQALMEVQKMKEQYQAQTMKIRGVAGSDFVDSLSKPLFDQMDARSDFLSGKIGGDVLKTRVERAQNTSQLALMQDAELANLMAASKLLGGALPAKLQAQVSARVMNLAANNQDPSNPPANVTPHKKAEGKEVANYMDSIKAGIKAKMNKDPSIVDPVGTWGETQNHVNQVLAGTSEFSSSQRSPKQLNQVMDFLSSPEFLNYQKEGGRIDADAISNVKNTITVNYSDKLIPAIQTEWEKAKVITGFNISSSSPTYTSPVGMEKQTQMDTANNVVEYVWSGDALTFRPTAKNLTNAAAVAKARELNKSLAPLVNRLVRANAHMEGSSDYSKYFKENEQRFFGSPE